MKYKHISSSILLLITVIFTACNQKPNFPEANAIQRSESFSIIPKPNSINLHPAFKESDSSYFDIKPIIKIEAEGADIDKMKSFIAEYLQAEISDDDAASLMSPV